MSAPIKVAVFDDVLAARREVFHIPGLDVGVFSHADDVCAICHGAGAPEVVCMDYAMGQSHASGEDAIRAVRAMGYQGHILAMSSDPAANAAMVAAGADEILPRKAMLRSYLVALGAGQVKRRQTAGGFVNVQLLALLGVTAIFTLGVLLVGPWGHTARPADLVGRVLGGTPSALDGAMAVPVGHGQLEVAAEGQRWTIVSDARTAWQVSPGPARGHEVEARVTAGQLLSIRGVRQGQTLAASLITDEAHRAALGPDEIGRPAVQVGGLALLGLGAVLLAGAPRG